MHRRYWMIAALVTGCATVRQGTVLEYLETQQGSPLIPYLHCKCGDALEIVQVNSRGDQAPFFREIRTRAGGIDTVSVTEGYRVLYAYKGADYFFANVKVESSDSVLYPSDKRKLIDMLRSVPSDTALGMVFQDRRVLNGLEVYGGEKTELDKGGVIGTYLVFSDVDHVIVSVSLLNQGTSHRRFNDMEGYARLRDQFLERFTECMRARDPRLPVSL